MSEKDTYRIRPDFDGARTQRNITTRVIPLDSALVDMVINVPGTLLLCDRQSTGYVYVEPNTENGGGALDAITLLSGDSIECPFRSVKLNAPAQAGKQLVLKFCIGVSVRAGSGLSTGTSVASVVSSRAAFTNTQKTVANTEGQLLAANSVRNYLLIQNKDASGDVYVTFGAAPATTAAGVKIAAGGFYEPSVVPTDQIRAIGSIASNANVVVVEGN